jgi:hypothetical protein
MDSTSPSRSAGQPVLTAPSRRAGAPRVFWVGAAVLLALVLAPRPAQTQSCAGKVTGDVCRPAAGACDVAETCVAPASSPAPMFQPTDGYLSTDIGWYYNMGYAFTPNKSLTVTSLGGFFNGTKAVYLYNRSTGAMLASAMATAANTWGYAAISPVTLTAGTSYSVAVYLGGSGGAYRTGMAGTPRSLTDATVEGSCYLAGSIAEPCASSGLISGSNYGMADFQYTVSAGGNGPLYQPTDGYLATDVGWYYNMGYAFTPNKTLTVNALGGFFNGTKTVYLYNRSTGAVLASASVSAANSWGYTAITPVTLAAGTPYTVSVDLGGTGGAYRANMSSMPSVLGDATLNGTCYRYGSTAEPCGYSGLIQGTNYGMADIKYSTGTGLVCPADTFVPAGSVCRGAAGVCDVAETCTGSSAACPANAFVPAGAGCNDGQLCTYNDVCNGAGSCGGTTITCGGGNACSTTACNGTSTCEPAKVFCDDPPGECYNTLGTCNTTNGSCSYTVKVGAPCGTRGTCQSSGSCSPPLPVQATGVQVPSDCASQTIPAPTPLGCDSCDASHACVVDSTENVAFEYQTCSGYTPRKGDIVLHEALGLTRMLVTNFGPSWTHIGVFLGPQQGSPQQLVRHHALNFDGLADTAVIKADKLHSALYALSLDKSSAYCKSAKLDAATLFDSVQFLPGIPNSHTADMVTEQDGLGGLWWEDGIVNRKVIIAANRAAGEDVANRMSARNDYYSLNSLLDEAKGRARLSNNKPGTNCASAIMSCITPEVPRTLAATDQIRTTANQAYEAIRHLVRHMPDTESAVTTCKNYFCAGGYLPYCPVDCNGLAWEVANGIADQVIACILFGPTSGGCECTRDNRKWHFAAWSSAPYSPPTQDDLDWVNGRMTDVEFAQDTWTGTALSQPPVTIYPSYTYLPADVLKSGNYPPANAYPLIKKQNATRKWGHCWAPPTLTVTPSPAAAYYGWPITWTATATGGDPASRQYAFFRRRSGTSTWTPDVSSPAWQASNSFTWTPTSGDAGTWDTYVWVKDAYTPANMNTYGYAAGYNTGGVQIVAPPTLSVTPSPTSVNYGTTINWTATASDGVPSTRQYALFRRRAGTSNWIPDVWSPAWQSSNVMSWNPGSSDVATWEIYVWLKDSATPPTMNTYGYAAGFNAGPVQVTSSVSQLYPPTGWVDGFNTQHIWGWACDPDYPTQSNRVDVWTTNWSQFFGSAGAYYGSSSAINSVCRGGTSHYFDFWPSGGIPSGTHIYVWSIDLPYSTPGNDNRRIGGSGSTGDGYEFVIP